MKRKSRPAEDVRTAIKMLRVLRHDVRVKLELARMSPSDEWRKLEEHLHELEKATEVASEPSRAAVAEGMRKLQNFNASLPSYGL
jgi:hypothetical protein